LNSCNKEMPLSTPAARLAHKPAEAQLARRLVVKVEGVRVHLYRPDNVIRA
jgi:hypothetical protein